METPTHPKMTAVAHDPFTSNANDKQNSDPELKTSNRPSLVAKKIASTPLTELSRSSRLQKYFGLEIDSHEVSVRDLFNNNQRKDVQLCRSKSHGANSPLKDLQATTRAKSANDVHKKKKGVIRWLNNKKNGVSSPNSTKQKKSKVPAMRSPIHIKMSGCEYEFSPDNTIDIPDVVFTPEIGTPSKAKSPDLSGYKTPAMSPSCLSPSTAMSPSSRSCKKRRLFRFK